MGDPLSVAANVVALAGFASETCHGLRGVLHRYSTVVKELKHYSSEVQALKQIFDGIADLERNSLLAPTTLPDTRDLIQRCIIDLQTTQATISQLCQKLQDARLYRRSWTKIRLALGERRSELNEQLARIESYHRVFSLKLSLLILYGRQQMPVHISNLT